jgi:predicted nucleic acid-binding protein
VRFVDTSFWVALQFARDQHHEVARQLWVERRSGLLTTNHVLGETWTFLNRRLGHVAAREFVDRAIQSARLSLHHVDETTEEEAWRWLRRHDERTYSFVDATSFAVMRRFRVTEALAFDGDFAAAGFIELHLTSA